MNPSNGNAMFVRMPHPPIIGRIREAENCVIEASAGTGKTYTLQNLFIDLLAGAGKRPGLPIDQILLVTFTEKAVQELRTRCHVRLAEVVRQMDEAERYAIQEGDLSMGGRVWPEGACSPKECAFCVSHRGACPLKGSKDRGEEGGLHCWRFDDFQRRRLRAALTGFDSANICTIHSFCQRALAEEAFGRGALFQESVADEGQLMGKVFRRCLRMDFHRDRAAWEAVKRWNASGNPLETERGGGEQGASFQKKSAALEDILSEVAKSGGLSAAAEGDWTADADSEEAADGDMVRQVVEALYPVFQRALEEEKRSGGLMVFNDMLERLDQAVDDGGAPSALAESLASRYRCILVDEFQDTDQVQWRIFDRLRMCEGGPRVMVIGDPKQSIYRFRNADLPTYEKARDSLSASNPANGTTGQRLTLDTNYRTSPDLLAAFNALFDPEGENPLSGKDGFAKAGDVPLRMQSITWAGGAPIPLEEAAGWTPGDLKKVELFRKAEMRLVRTGRGDGGEAASDDGSTGLYREREGGLWEEIREGGGEDKAVQARFLTHADYGTPVVKAGKPSEMGVYTVTGRDGDGKEIRSPGAGLCLFRVDARCGTGSGGKEKEVAKKVMGRTLANLVAAEILRLTRPDSPVRIDLEGNGCARPVRRGDIFVLVRSRSEAFKALTKVLKGLGIPYACRDDSVFKSQAWDDVRDVLAAIATPYDAALVRRAALTPFFGCAMDELGRDGEGALEDRVRSHLLRWSLMAQRADYAGMFQSMKESTGLQARQVFAGDARRLADTEHVFDLLLDAIGGRALSPAELLSLMDGIAAQRNSDGENGGDGASGAEQGKVRCLFAPSTGRGDDDQTAPSDAVQVLTMHSSKGLEAPVVFVLDEVLASKKNVNLKKTLKRPGGGSLVDGGGTDGRIKGVRKGLGQRPDDQRPDDRFFRGHENDIAHKVVMEDAADAERLAYVAMTRAAVRLYLPVISPNHVCGGSSWDRINYRLDRELVPATTSEDAGFSSDGALLTPEGGGTDAVATAVGRLERLGDFVRAIPGEAGGSTGHGDPDGRSLVMTSYTQLAHGKGEGTLKAVSVPVEDGGLSDLSGDGVAGRGREREPDLDGLDELDALEGGLPGEKGGDLEDSGEAVDDTCCALAVRGKADSSRDADGDGGEDVGEASCPGHDPLPGGADVGTFVHALFEKLPVQTIVHATEDCPDAPWRALAESRDFKRLCNAVLPTLGLDLSPAATHRAAQLLTNALTARLPLIPDEGRDAALDDVFEAGRTEDVCLLDVMRLPGADLVHEMEFLFPIPEEGGPDFRQLAGTLLEGCDAGEFAEGDASLGNGGGQTVSTGFVKGFVDVAFTAPDGRLWFGDWKTDRVQDASPEGLKAVFEERYSIQARLYTLAMVRLLGIRDEDDFRRRFGGFAYFFLRAMDGRTARGVHLARPGFDEVMGWDEQLRHADYSALKRRETRHDR